MENNANILSDSFILEKTKFNIGDVVYHINDSDRGVVIDITYSFRNKDYTYNVIFGRRLEDNAWCVPEEIVNEKSVI